MNLEIPDLPYAYDALEPHIDARTMEFHYDKHHRAYFGKFMGALEGSGLEGKSLQDIFAEVSGASGAIRNNGGGYYNHLLYWNCMSPSGGGSPSGALAQAIDSTFGSFDKLQTKIADAGATHFGSGFAWLVVDENRRLVVSSTPNQDNPLMDLAEVKGQPILTLDVWEHAYYLKFQNRRPDYIKSWWNVVDWKNVSRHFDEAMS